MLALPAAAAAGSGLLLGIDDDMGKWAANSPVAGSIADLGATVQRITVIWLPGQAGISGSTRIGSSVMVGGQAGFADRLLSAMRFQFGGHTEKK